VRERERVERALLRFERLEQASRCQVLYADESGFCLQPCLPYLWQKKGQTVGLPAQSHRQRLSVLGLLRKKDAKLWHFPTLQRLTSQHLIESIELLLPTLEKPTVLVLDNARVHRARAVQEKRREWKRKGLRLFFLPPYCPHLNAIEVLWRQVKYRWLPITAYQQFEWLCASVVNVLDQVGINYHITFA
jgi:transposase